MKIKCPPHISVVLHVKDDPALERDVVAWVEACRVQLAAHVAPAWGWDDAPGVFYYGTAEGMPPAEAAVIGIFRDARNPEAAGYHAAIGQRVIGAVDLSRSDSPSRTLSHEIVEIYRNAFLDQWLPGPIPDRAYAAELCDPVQTISYTVRVNVLGEDRIVEVADFLLPSWFGITRGEHYDHCRCIGDRFTIAPGGYQIAREGDSILWLPAKNDAVRANAVHRPLSRTSLISTGVTVDH